MSSAPATPRPRVVILGGGFAGLYAARALKRAPVDVTVVDRRNHHLFQPLLYQVASAALDPSDIAYPIRAALRRQKNTLVILDRALAVHPDRNIVELESGDLPYDHLIVATGATHSYFGHDDWQAVAPGLKTIEDALEIRRRVLLAYEAAERDPPRAAEWLTFVIVGAGPTGVELAGSFIEIARHTLAADFRRIDPRQARVVLLEAGPRVLPAYPPDLSTRALEQLERLGVDVRLDSLVTAVAEHGVEVGGERIDSPTVLWAAGVKASRLAQTLGAPLDRAGRVLVRDDLTIPDHADVYVAGDLAAIRHGDGIVPGVAPAAIQAGRYAARAITSRLRGRPVAPFRYRDKGSLATIGRAAAVADFGRLRISGWSAWLAWLFVHVAFLIGFRNRLFVLLSWAWSYLTFQRGARLITGLDPKLLPPARRRTQRREESPLPPAP